MDTEEKIIKILTDNKDRYISGNDIARQLNITRSAVWKYINSIKKKGYSLQAVTNKGYKLEDETDVISESGIKKYMSRYSDIFKICIYPEISSTNTVLKKEAQDGKPEGYVIISSAQTTGKGRLGRSFFSPENSGIYLSLLLRPNLSAEKSVLITTAAAVAVCQAIEQFPNLHPGIKWVNDIFVNGRKVCGILTEASFDIEGGAVDYAVLGVGINVYSPDDGFSDELKDIAGSVLSEKTYDAKNKIIARFLESFFKIYKDMDSDSFIDEYKSRSIILNKSIFVISGENKREAIAEDIDNSCRLLVRYPDGEKSLLSSGEVSIRGIN